MKINKDKFYEFMTSVMNNVVPPEEKYKCQIEKLTVVITIVITIIKLIIIKL